MPNGDKQLCRLYVTMVTSTIQVLFKIILFGKVITKGLGVSDSHTNSTCKIPEVEL